jgi:hypothetical protein
MFPTKDAQKIKTHILCSITFFFLNHSIYEIMWKNIVEPDRPQMTIPHMHIASKIAKATITHSEYVTHSSFL